MPRDGSGTMTLAEAAFVNGTVADADDINSDLSDIAAEITSSLDKAGRTTWTATQNAAGYGIKTLANTKVHDTAGGTTAYTVTTGASYTAYTQIPLIFVKANATNTGSMTINVDSIGALTCKKNGATNLASGDFVSGYVYAYAYDGTNLQLIAGSLATLFQPLDATLTALAALSWSSGTKTIVFTAADTVSLIDGAQTTYGIYSPTAVGVANIDSVTDYNAKYFRVGDMITVFGRVDINPTAAANTLTQVRLDLPVASNLSVSYDLVGHGSFPDITGAPICMATILADTTNDEALIQYYSQNAGGNAMLYHYSYRVI